MEKDTRVVTVSLDLEEATLVGEALAVYGVCCSQLPPSSELTQKKYTALGIVAKIKPQVARYALEDLMEALKSMDRI